MGLHQTSHFTLNLNLNSELIGSFLNKNTLLKSVKDYFFYNFHQPELIQSSSHMTRDDSGTGPLPISSTDEEPYWAKRPNTAPIKAEFVIWNKPLTRETEDEIRSDELEPITKTNQKRSRDETEDQTQSPELHSDQKIKLTRTQKKKRAIEEKLNRRKHKKENGTGMNRARAFVKTLDSVSIQLCSFTAIENECQRDSKTSTPHDQAPKCRFSHDLQAYLQEKASDITSLLGQDLNQLSIQDIQSPLTESGPKTFEFKTRCPLYEGFGHCSFGYRCRFLWSHLQILPQGTGFQASGYRLMKDETKIERYRIALQSEARHQDGKLWDRGVTNVLPFEVIRNIRKKLYPLPLTQAYLQSIGEPLDQRRLDHRPPSTSTSGPLLEPAPIPDATPIPEDTSISEPTPISEATPISDATLVPQPATISDATLVPEATTFSDAPLVPQAAIISDVTLVPKATTILDATLVPEATTILDATAILEAGPISDAAFASDTTPILVDESIPDNSTVHEARPEALAQCSEPCEAKKDLPIDLSSVRYQEKRQLEWRDKLYLAPLTTVGNLPYRRLCASLGAEITCAEMTLAQDLIVANTNEWSLVKRHESEKIFGVQVAGARPQLLVPAAEMIANELEVDFVDVNCGCPIDLVFKKGAGAALLDHAAKLGRSLVGMSKVLGEIPLTVKLRTGVAETRNTAHKIMPRLQTEWGVGATTLHGRSRQQRYSKRADWSYISKCVRLVREAVADEPDIAPIPIFGNGDCYDYREYYENQELSGVDGVMVARGALTKPWIFTEIKERRDWDISSRERLDQIGKLASFGLEHWGSDTQGVNTTRRFVCEALGFQYRYVPVGLLERLPARINDRPYPFKGRDELETLLASGSSQDWVKISSLFLGPPPADWVFTPKHKSNAYEEEENG